MLADLNIALRNAPKETQAQLIANSKVNAMKKANPDMTTKEIKKASQQALTEARIQMGAERIKIPLDEKRWEAIQAGAISESQLIKILNNADIDEVRQYATPRTTSTLILSLGEVLLSHCMNPVFRVTFSISTHRQHIR